ncbi:MAG: hypothetical protein KKD01_17205 [Proteobacteria bacterium]|nr:hypothetical protein [Pseudomonadota bacterium]MBU1232873.1 hypothetical protein [Pseudomonadota bacterium]MBU1418444.1 hypothetical protein [Pseudomonadota bacterium]MBU1456464.1 hypothetical protein [Pseudomonadota bacterium]
MTVENKKNSELEILNFEQVATLCCVSKDRVKKWVEKRCLKSLAKKNEQVRCDDLVDFLVQYNMTIPASILPVEAKKILFVFSSETLGYIYVTFLKHFFEKLREEEKFISDTICYNMKVKYKILTFVPDLIIADTIGAHDKALQLINFAKKTGEFKILAIIEKNLSEKKIGQIRAAKADAVVTRSIKINELVETIHTLFK